MTDPRHVLLAVALLVVVTPAGADVIHIPGDAPTIQAGIDLATDGDEVVLANGTYTGPGNRDISFGGRAITVRSAGGDPALCVIDCEHAGRGFVFDSGEDADSRLAGVTIANGSADIGGGIQCVSTSPTFEQCRVEGCTVVTAGGGMFLFNSTAELTGCVFADNFAKNGGGLYNAQSSPSLDGCTFTGNVADSGFEGDAHGAGVFNSSGSDPIITGCLFTSNTCVNDTNQGLGGGIYAEDDCVLIVSGCEFAGNRGHWASALVARGPSLVQDCLFRDHIEVDGVVGVPDDATIIGCEFRGNSGRFLGDAALKLFNNSTALVVACLFRDNDMPGVETAFGCEASILFCTFSGHTRSAMRNNDNQVLVDRCLFVGNSAARGAAMYNISALSGSPGPRVRNCVFSGNTAFSAAGAIYHYRINTIVTNCSFEGNTAPQGGAMASFQGGFPVITNCVIWGNGPTPVVDVDPPTSEATLRWSIVEGGWTGPGGDNLDADPLFVDPDASDLRLLPGSPAIDAGDNSVVDPCGPDLDGNERIADDPDTPDTGPLGPPTVDMGAYEFAAPPFCPADTDGDGVVNVDDLVNVILDWGTDGSANGGDVTGPLPGSPPDGLVDVNDLNAIVVAWGPCCP